MNNVSRIPPEIQKLVPGYLNNRHSDLGLLKKALETNDFKTMKFIGHNIKGNAENYGFDDLTPIGAKLEQAAMDENAEILRDCIEELAKFLADVSA